MTQTIDTFGMMFTLQPDGSFAMVPHDSGLLCFSYNGTAITNPCKDESSTVDVDPRYYGFSEVQQGEAEALRLDQEDGTYLLLGPAEVDTDDQVLRLSLHGPDGALQAYCNVDDIP